MPPRILNLLKDLNPARILYKYTAMKVQTFGVVYTVKNEEDLISSAIEYYSYLGASIIWVFIDGSTDNTETIARQYSNVVCLPSISPSEVLAPPPWVSDIAPRWESNSDVRKRINALHAARLANESNIDWILAIDPDELLYLKFDDIHPCRVQNALSFYLANVPQNIDQILFLNLESIPCTNANLNPFKSCTFFTKRNRYTMFATRAIRYILRKLSIHSNSLDQVENLIWNIRFLFKLGRRFKNPITNDPIFASYYYGYNNFKPIVRTKIATDLNFNTHKWITDKGRHKHRLKNLVTGYILHYDFYSSSSIIKKFSKRTINLRSNAKNFRNEVAFISCNLDEKSFSAFYNEFMVQKNINDLIHVGGARRIDAIIDIFAHIDEFKSNTDNSSPPLRPEHDD